MWGIVEKGDMGGVTDWVQQLTGHARCKTGSVALKPPLAVEGIKLGLARPQGVISLNNIFT